MQRFEELLLPDERARAALLGDAQQRVLRGVPVGAEGAHADVAEEQNDQEADEGVHLAAAEQELGDERREGRQGE